MLIMLIEDDPFAVKGYELFFKSIKGYDLIVCKTAEEALIKLLAEGLEPDVIVLDLKLEKTSGERFLEVIKGSEKTKNIPIIVVTAFPFHKKEIMEMGVNAFFEKPVDVKSLVEKIEEVAKEKR